MALYNPDVIRRKFDSFQYNFDLPKMLQLMNFIEEKLRLLVNMNRIKDSFLLRLLAQAQTYANIAKLKNWSAWVEFAEICFLHQPSSASAV